MTDRSSCGPEQGITGGTDSSAIELGRLYRPRDAALRQFATEGTLAQWRHHCVGPPFIRYGNRVLYRGRDLLAWLEDHTVYPRDSSDRKSKTDPEAV